MFDLTSTKLLLLAVVALLVIGPKDFPVLLRTIGKYVAIIRGHAREFRAQFDEALRETELSQLKSDLGQLKKDMEKFGQETEASLTATTQSVGQTLDETRRTVEGSLKAPLEEAASKPAAELSTLSADIEAAMTSPAAPTSPDSGGQPAPSAPEPPSAAPATAPAQPVAPAAAQTAGAPAVERTGA